jgi:small conductance mechanosensitive channel
MDLDVETLIIVGALLVAAVIATILIGRLTRRVERRIEDTEGAVSVKRAKTLTSVLRVSAVIAVWVVLSLTALAQAGVQVGPLLAAAGLGGIVLGLGAQSLVSDLIAGFFIVAERQYDVGDVVELQPGSGGPVTGEVESIALRTTTLRGLDATRHVVPNGQIVVASNQTRDRSRYMVDLPIAYEADPDAAAEIARRVGEQMRIEPRFREAITGPVEVLGVDAFADSAVVVRTYLQTAPGRQWEVGREFRRRVLRELAEAGIEIPFPQRTVTVKTAAGD